MAETRHSVDRVALVAGLVFVLVAVVAIAVSLTSTAVDPRWALPAVLLVVGVVGLSSALPRRGED